MLCSKALHDKREGPCKTGPCRLPRRCQLQETCFLYSTSNPARLGEGRAARTVSTGMRAAH